MRGVLCIMASRVLLPALTFGYGIFTMALYALISMRHGYFFKGTSEKELLELQLGMLLILARIQHDNRAV